MGNTTKFPEAVASHPGQTHPTSPGYIPIVCCLDPSTVVQNGGVVRYWVVIANAGGSGTLHVVPDASHFDTAPFDTNGGQTLVTFTATLKNPIPDQNASVTVSANGVAITSQSAM